MNRSLLIPAILSLVAVCWVGGSVQPRIGATGISVEGRWVQCWVMKAHHSGNATVVDFEGFLRTPDKKPAVGVTVGATGPSGPQRTAKTNAIGKFEVRSVPQAWFEQNIAIKIVSSGYKYTGPTTKTCRTNHGFLSGVYDGVVPAVAVAGQQGSPANVLSCITTLDHIFEDNELYGKLRCYADLELGDPNGEPPMPGGEGPDGVEGPPPPPPYTVRTEEHAQGILSGDDASLTTCFWNAGGPFSPNMIAVADLPDVTTDMTDGVVSGTITLYANQPYSACADLSPVGSGSTLPLQLYRVAEDGLASSGASGGCDDSPFPGRSVSCLDYDGDGCGDEEELEGVDGCGDDPYNPHDGNIADLDGAYEVLVTFDVGANCPGSLQCDWGSAEEPVPGAYFHCLATQSGTNPTYDTRIYCYIDIPGVEVNPEGFPGCAGDGLPGASPPGVIDPDADGPGTASCAGDTVIGDVDSKHTELTSSLSGSTLITVGCFEDSDGQSPLGHVYVSSTQNVFSGLGTVDVYFDQTIANCNAGTPTGAPTTGTLQVARQTTALDAAPASESGAECANALDDDGDTRVNDGCPPAGASAEIGFNDGDATADDEPCTNAINDDAADDALINDGCPPYGNSSTYRDTDSDGCSDAEELGDSGAAGGLRDPYNRGDWADVDGNGTVDLFVDIFGIAAVFGAASPGPPYDEAFDVGGTVALGGQPWTQRPPDGTVDLFNDIFGAAFQFGHAC